MKDDVADRDDWTALKEGVPPAHQYGVRHLMFLIVACAALFAVLGYAGWVALAFGLMIVPVALVLGGIILLFNGRRAQQDAMLWAVSHAARRRLPLGPGIEAFADLCGRRFRRRALDLARLVDQGVPLPDAIERVPWVFPRPAALYTRMGWAPDVLARALRDVAAARGAWQPFRHSLTLRIFYLGWVLFIIQVQFSFVLYWIIPKFEAIFADFGVEMPEVTIAVITVGNALVNTGMLPILLLVELVFLLALPLVFLDWFHWDISLLDRLVRRRHAAVVLRALSYGMEGGEPLPAILGVLVRSYPSRWVRRRLARVRDDVAAGADWRASLRRRGFLRRSETAVLEAAQRVGNLPWALRELADGIERRLRVRLYAGGQVLFPLLIMALGAMVALLAVAFFLPLVQLIQKVAP